MSQNTATISEILENRAADQGDRPAYVFLSHGETGVVEERLTYAELDARARAIGASLQAAGASGERVALLFPPGPDFVVSFFGCLHAGSVAVPSLPPRRRGADPRLAAICRDARPRVALTTAGLLPALESAAAEIPELAAALRMAPATEGAADWRRPDLRPEALAFLQYTSGSTSTPKGVMVSHGNLLHNEELIRRTFEQSSDSVVLGWLPLYHDMGLIGTMLQPLYAGAVGYLMTPGAFLQRPARWLEAISRYRATTSGGPNFAYELCVRKVGEAEREGLDLSSWRVAFNGAEPVRAGTLRRFAAAFAPCGFRASAFRPCYGLAEATLLVSGLRQEGQEREPRVRALDAEALERHEAADAVDAGDTARSRELVGCGLGMQTVLAVDPESGEPCPPSRVGEIWVAGPSVAQGYWERPEETAATFGARLADGNQSEITGPFLRTGDLGFVSEGELFLTGRLKDLIILRGRNHYPQDLELTAERSHADLRAGGGAAFAVDGAGEERLVIVHEVERHARAGMDAGRAEEIAAAVRQRVAEEHEVSVAEVVLIGPETLPRTSSGKVRRRACSDLYLQGGLRVLGASRLAPAAAEEDPRSEVQVGSPDWLRQAFAAAARIDPARIDPDLPLSASGLDSLAAVELKQTVEEVAGISLSLADLLEGMTLRELEARVGGERQVAEEIPPGVETPGYAKKAFLRKNAACPGLDGAAGEHPLSWNQRSLWFLHLLAPESSAYNIAGAARLEASSSAALERALQTLVDRHPMLRATFADTPGGLVQRVAERADAAFEIVDATGWSDTEVDARLHAEAYRPFDLAAGPLLRAILLRRGDEAFLALAVHHIAADFWSMAVLARELGGLVAGETLPPPAALYTDFSCRQQEMLESPAGERLWEHWRERLTGMTGTVQLDLPTDRPRRPVQTVRGGARTLPPSLERTEAVHRLAATHGCTPFVALLAAWQAVLSRWSGQEEFLTGAPMAGRSSREWAEVVGYFVNLVPLRADLCGNPVVGELMARTRRIVLDALAHQDLPFALLTERLQPIRDPSRPPLVPAMLTFEKAPAPDLAGLAAFAVGVPGVRLDLGGLVLESLPLAPPAAQLDLSLMAAELPAGLAISLQWDADLFDETTAARMLGHLDRLLAGMAAAADRGVAELPLLAAEERDQILLDWSGAESAPTGAGCLHELFEAQAARTPEATALIVGAERSTYDELNHRANRLAHHLRRLGVRPEQRVGVLMRRSSELIATLLGILKAGAAYVPLDPTYPDDWRAFAARDAGIALLLTEDAEELAGQESEENPEPLAGPGNLAYVIYTSGSTGRPKGVALEHRSPVERMLWARAAFPAEDLAGVLAATSICFDLSVFEIFAPLSWGGTVILADNVLALPALPARDEVTLVNTVPAAMTELAAGELPPALRTVNLAGEALPPQLVERIYRHAQVERVLNLYGPTEDCTYSTGGRVERGVARVSIGHPLPGTRAYVLDGHLQPVPGGVPGELFLAGAGGARGYFNRPDLTAERFIPDPFGTQPGGRLYRTGDLARWLPLGELEHLGRLDHQVKVRGFRIELREIEAALLAHPEVRQASVNVREIAGSKALVAHLAGGEPSLAAAALREHLRRLLPEHMVPAFFVQLPALPLTPNGKVDRKALSAPNAAPVLPVAAPADVRLSGIEEAVAAIWCEVLGLPRVGREDNFFDLGGHSLLLPRVQAGLRGRLGREVTLVDLLSHSTVRTLARHLEIGLVVAEPAPRAPRTRGGGAIAIVGLAGRFPGAPGVESLWANLCAGVSSIARLSDEELSASGVAPELRRDPRYVPAAGVLDGVELFDAGFFGYSPREAELMDPQQRLFLECAWEALEDAGYDSRRTPGPVGMFASLGFNRYLHQILTAVDPAEVGALQLALGNDKDFLATRVSYKLDLSGPSMTVQTACSSSLVAVHVACRNLQQGDCDMALAGGVSIVLPQRAGYLYEEGGIASPDGCCRAFDSTARGTVFGSGAGIVVLKRLEDALADGDTIRAVLLGSAVNNDGGSGKAGYTAPSVAGQAAVISSALANAGVDPATVSYVEAHGTGTPLGDPIEVQALAQAFRNGGAREGSCALGSVKSNLGHLDTAAGVTGLIKTVLALQHGVLPPSLGFSQPNPRIDFAAGPFHVQSELADWERGSSPRRAGVSSFGIGGTNAHAVLEEPPAAPRSESTHPWHLFVLSAHTPAALERKRAELADHLDHHPEIHPADAAYTLQLGRRAFSHRCIATARDAADVAAVLRGEAPERLFARTAPEMAPPVVFLFPGQGSQRPGMGAGLYRAEPVFRREIDRCCEILLPILGFDLRDLLLAPAESEEAARRLAATEVTQPALFVIEHALTRLWISWGVQPQAMIGHSIGEYVAACLGGVFSLEDALALVAARGRLVASLPPGAMLAVSLPEAEAARRAEESGLAVAAVNAPESCVLSGAVEAVEQLAARLAAEGIEHRRLRTSHAFHSPALDPVLDRFRAEVARLDPQLPRLPWISTLSGTWIRPEEATDPGYWARHLREAVRFADGVEELLRVPGRVYLEVGPGRALSSLVRARLGRSEEGAVLASLPRTGEPEEDVRQVGEALGRLWLAGVEIDWPAVHAQETRRRVPLPAYPFERQRFWIEGTPRMAATRPAAQEIPEKLADIAAWFHAPSWQRTPRPRGGAGALTGRWLVLLDPLGLGDHLAERLAAAGCAVATARAGRAFSRDEPGRYTLDPHAAGDFEALLADLGAVPDRVLHLWSLGETPAGEAQARGYQALISLTQALAGRLEQGPAEICVIADGLCDVESKDQLHPEKATLFGPLRVIPQEHLGIACRLIDVDAGEIGPRLGDRLLAELSEPGTDPVIAWRGPHRWSSTFAPVPLAPAADRSERSERPALLQDGETYLITGGMGALGLALADHLARTVAGPRLVLTGRSVLPEGGPVQALVAAGAEVLTLAADVTDEAAMCRAVEMARQRFGRIHGVFHAAGVPGAGLLQLKTRETALAALGPKVRGTLVLESVLHHFQAEDPPEFLVLFSSLNALTGGIGQVDYSAANAFLGAFARSRDARGGTRVIAIDWCAWQEDRWTAELAVDPRIREALRRQREVLGLTLAEGMEALDRILESGLPEVVVSTCDLAQALHSAAAPAAVVEGWMPGVEGHARPALETPWAAPSTATEETLAALWGEVLGIAPIGRHDSFFELGGHSLLGLQLTSRIRAGLGVEIPLRTLFEAPTVAALAGEVDALRRQGEETDEAGLPPLVRVPREGPLPLSFAQQRLWLIDQLEPGSPLYNISVTLRVEGALDAAALARTLGEIVRRHEALRTVFAVPESSPVQVILPAEPFQLPVVDLSGLPEERRETQALALAGEAAGRPFDLGDLRQGPLLRGVLLRLAVSGEQTDHAVALTMHHIASDGWSMGILVREVAALYPALVTGQLAGLPSLLPEMPVQYADFAVWQRSWLHGEVLENEIAWWRHQLAGLPPLLELPTDRPRPAVQSYRGAKRPVRLPAGLMQRMEALARREGATLFMVLLAGFQALLARTSGQDDLAVGTPVAGRNQMETEGLIGFFVNTLVLRGDLSGAPSFTELLGRARETALAALLHQEVPFEKLVDELAPERSLAQTPLFQVVLALHNVPLESLEIPGLRLRPLKVDGATAKFDLMFELTEHDGELLGAMEYATDLFDAATIDRLILQYEGLLTAALGMPDLPAPELPLIGEVERHQVLVEWNDTAAAREAEPALIHEPFEAWARRTPDAVAAVWRGETLTYGALEERASRLADHLAHLGAGPGSLIGIHLRRGPGLIVAALAVLKAGAAYVPLEIGHPPARLRWIVDTLEVSVLITETAQRDGLPAVPHVICLDQLNSIRSNQRITARRASADDLAYVIFTSGSTGTPKGVMVRHRPVVNLLRWAHRAFAFSPADRVLFVTALSFDLSVFDIFGLLGAGGSIRIADEEEIRDPERLLRALAEEPITFWDSAPAALEQTVPFLTGMIPQARPALRLVFLSGDWIPVTLPDRIRERFAGARVVSLGGATEATVWSNVFPVGRVEPSWTSIPYGRPIENARYHVLDARFAPCPVGVPGDLYIGGDCLADGYAKEPVLTAHKFLPDPWSSAPGARLYRTGDRARYRPDGNLEFLGRLDHQVKIRGFRIELGEIETALASLPGVREAAVVVREDRSEGGARDRRLVAYVAGDVTAGDLRTSLRERLPEYMVPAAFVRLAALPLTANGKVDRKALPAPEPQRAEESWLAPRTPVEEVLAGIWAELLGRERVGADSHFFDLGGHSLLATQVMSRLRATLRIDLPLRDLFEAPVLADLAARGESALRSATGRVTPPLVRLAEDRRSGALPLSAAQQRLWFIDQLEPGSPLYNIPVALRVEGPLRSDVLALTLGEVVRRHEALRTVFALRDGAPVQVIQPAAPFALPVVDMTGLPEREREALALALAGEEASRPFDLARGPLLRGVLLRLAVSGEQTEHVLALTMHHIASDGWSMGVLVREVAALYAAFAEGAPSPLPELPVQYVDFAVWQSSWLRGEFLEGEISFWRRQLAGLPPVLELPTDRPRPAVQSYRGSSRPVRLPAGLTRQAQALGRQEGATLFMALLAGFQALLARTSGQRDLAVGSPVAGRNRVETEGLIGFFVNTLVLRGGLMGDDGAPAFRELLGRARETALAAWLHQDVPFEKLVQELDPERSLAHAPLFQVMFALQNAPVESLEIRDLRLRLESGAGTTAKFDLLLSLDERDSELLGTVEYATDLFDAATIDRLILQYEGLLTAALATPDLSVAELPLLTGAERHQLLVEWNDTAAAREAEPALIHEPFEAWARRTPEAVAAVWRGETLTYGALEERASRLAGHLAHLGAGPGSLIGIHLRRGPGLIVAALAVLKAGAAYVPLEIGHPPARLRWIVDTLEVSVLITETAQQDNVPALAHVICLDQLDSIGSTQPIIIQRRASADDLAYIIFTSGSTGTPKGVMVRHRPVVNLLRWAHRAFAFSPSDRVLFVTALSFDLSVFDVFGLLGAGGSIRIADEEEIRDPERLLRALAEEPITFWDSAPAALEQTVPFLTGLSPQTGPALRLVFLSGDWIPVTLPDRIRERFPGAQVVSLGGATEATVWSNVFPVGRVEPSWTSIPYGRPIENARYHVLENGLAPCPVGVPGDLYIGGDCLADGYAKEPVLTAQKFLPDPWSVRSGARLYRTGDRARYRPDGNLEFLGRLDHQVKIRGFRIELGEIETALASLPGVREAAVLVREDRAAGGDRRLVAYVAGDATAEALRASLRERLPEYMVPAAFVRLAALPLTANGKVDRKALPAPVAQGVAEESLAPRTPVEEILASIWTELLGFERVGADSHFFDLGGHSLLATRVLAHLRATLGVELALRDLFEAPRLADLAARIEAARQSGRQAGPLAPAPPLLPAPREGALPLSFAQERLWFIDQLEPGSPLYNIPVVLRVGGPLRSGVLALALGEVVRRHEALRTVFAAREDAPVQLIQPAGPFDLSVVDLAGLPETAREPLALALAREEGGRPFDLGDSRPGPLLRGVLLRLAEDAHVLALTVHHIASDGWSMGILVHEVAALYQAFLEEKPSPLPELPIQYGDFAVWQRGWLDREAQEGLVEHWRHRLAGAPSQLDLPGARPRPALLSPRGAVCQRRFTAPFLEQLRALGRRESATLFMTLLAPLQALLHTRTGATDLVVGTDVAGRGRRETEGLIGFFINQLPLRVDLAGDPTLRELLGRTRETALEAYAHQDLPFDHLVEALRVERSLGRSPVFQVKLALQNTPWEGLNLPGLTLKIVDSNTETAQLDLLWSFVERDGELWLALTYNTDLFDEPLIARLLDQYEVCLRVFVERPEARLGELAAVLAQAEQDRLAERARELKSKNIGKLRSRRQQAEATAEAPADELTEAVETYHG